LQLWVFVLIVAVVLLLFGAIVDFIAKKKNIRLDPEEGLKNASESERIYKENNLNQNINNFNNPFQ
jgi:hypothetical protein